MKRLPVLLIAEIVPLPPPVIVDSQGRTEAVTLQVLPTHEANLNDLNIALAGVPAATYSSEKLEVEHSVETVPSPMNLATVPAFNDASTKLPVMTVVLQLMVLQSCTAEAELVAPKAERAAIATIANAAIRIRSMALEYRKVPKQSTNL